VGIAQQFAHQIPKLCRLAGVLSTTAPGFTMVPASPAVLWKWRRRAAYTDKGYIEQGAADIYGGAFRDDPLLIGRQAARCMAPQPGLPYKLLAMSGWTSICRGFGSIAAVGRSC